MDFSRRKLPRAAAETLQLCPIHTVKPYAPMAGPVYVFMPRNEKFISVKAPLDFFTPEELARLAVYESFYFPEFISSVAPFRTAARSVKAILSLKPNARNKAALPLASYELSDGVLRTVGPLWGPLRQVEPFFLAIFATELCEALPGELLTRVREQDVDGYETALFRSSWAVFLALHTGNCDLDFLNRLRARVFVDSIDGVPERAAYSPVDELARVARESFDAEGCRVPRLRMDYFAGRGDRLSQKMISRLKRVDTELADKSSGEATIFGTGGFVDV